MPTVVEDYLRLRRKIRVLFDKLPISSLIFIGPSSLRELIESDPFEDIPKRSVTFIDESSILTFDEIKCAYDRRFARLYEGQERPVVSAVGWYYQQFLKLAYGRICESDHYLCWDSDTLPMRKIVMFNEDGIPFFDVKPEMQAHYFDTIRNLFGFGKSIEDSFVSEHMIFSCDLVREMLDEIEHAGGSEGRFYEKIFDAIDDLRLGFSEFETYGTWVSLRHTGDYRVRTWHSLRNANFMVDVNDVTDEDMNWLATDYDAATFEKYQKTEPMLNELFKNPRYREKLSAGRFYTELLEAGCFGDYKDGKIITDKGSFPS